MLGVLIAVCAVAAYGEERVMEEGVLEEVIVFAQKRAQPLLEVPISISTLCGEVAVAGISHQQALAFQITANPPRDGMGELGEFITCWRFNPAKLFTRSMGAISVNTVQKEHVEVDVSCEVLRYVE